MSEEQLIKELEKFGWKMAYFTGHGEEEVVMDDNNVIGDIEKTNILVPSSALWDKSVPYEEYF